MLKSEIYTMCINPRIRANAVFSYVSYGAGAGLRAGPVAGKGVLQALQGVPQPRHRLRGALHLKCVQQQP